MNRTNQYTYRNELLAIITVCMTAAYLKNIWRHFNNGCEKTYSVRLRIGDTLICTKGFLDTGNRLYEPVGHSAVCVLNPCLFRQMYSHEKYSGRIYVIPYRSIDNPSGIMPGIVADEMVIRQKNIRIVRRNVVLAVSRYPFGSYMETGVILHTALMAHK